MERALLGLLFTGSTNSTEEWKTDEELLMEHLFGSKRNFHLIMPKRKFDDGQPLEVSFNFNITNVNEIVSILFLFVIPHRTYLHFFQTSI